MTKPTDWDPRAPETSSDPIAACDDMRRKCPVAYSDALQHSVFRHADVMRVLADHTTFSNRVSGHISVPNGMDPPEHGIYRGLIEPYFGPGALARFAPRCRALCAVLMERLPAEGEVEIMSALAEPFALQAQCAFLGWPESLHEPLRNWMRKKDAADSSGDRQHSAAVALDFDATIRELLAQRSAVGRSVPDDVTARLMRETVGGRALAEDEIVSILRNWTVGELGTIAGSIGIIGHYLARHPDIQDTLRADPGLIPAANDEMLRIHAPLLSNRRVVAKPANIGDAELQPGDRLTVLWASANRDEAVFGDPDEFRLDRDPALNLLYGAGIHVCPGAPLARLELQIFVETMLEQTHGIQTVPGMPAAMAGYPATGYRRVPVRVVRRLASGRRAM